jgi:transcriptional regulator with XRE-family HTH domain
MSKLSKRAMMMRALFGEYLEGARINKKLSTYDVGKILGVTHATVHGWERGISFPVGISLLQRLKMIYPATSDEFKDIINRPKLRLTSMEKDRIDEIVEESDGSYAERRILKQAYRGKDESYASCKIKFGKFLYDARKDKELNYGDIAAIIKRSRTTFLNWENGSSFTNDIENVQAINYLFDERVLDVMFGLCLRDNIQISQPDKDMVNERLEETLNLKSIPYVSRMDNAYNEFNCLEPEWTKKAIEMRKEGKGYEVIANLLGVSRHNVTTYLKSRGFKSFQRRIDHDEVLKLRKKGFSLREIGEIVGCSGSYIWRICNHDA